MEPLPITNGFYSSPSLPVSAQECVNWYVNVNETQGALFPENLFGTPGSLQLATAGNFLFTNRGSRVMKGVPYFVQGQVLYRLNADFSLTSLGAIPGTRRVSMADNGTQLCIMVPGGAASKGYIFTASPDTLTEITDPDFRASGNPQYVVFVDGYFVFTTDSKKFISSELNDGLNYNALDFGTAEADPDDIVAPIVIRNQLFIGGSETMEAFQNIGGAGFPFQRTGLFITKGISAPLSIVTASDTFMFIGAGKNESPAIWKLDGNSVSKVSTVPIEAILQSVTAQELEEVFAWSYAQKGAYFVGFSLPSTTLVIETISGRWHERKSRIIDAQNQVQIVRSRINSLVQAYGLVLVGDSQDGRIGSLDPEVYTEYTNPIIRVVATQPFSKVQNNPSEGFSVPRLELMMEAGVGNAAVPDPSVIMERSLNGKIWKDGRAKRIGRIGEYDWRSIWRRNGWVPRLEVFRFTFTDAVKPVIIGLLGDLV